MRTVNIKLFFFSGIVGIPLTIHLQNINSRLAANKSAIFS